MHIERQIYCKELNNAVVGASVSLKSAADWHQRLRGKLQFKSKGNQLVEFLLPEEVQLVLLRPSAY